MRSTFAAVTLTIVWFQAIAAVPDCASPEAWPASMAFTTLKNSQLLNNDNVDFSKTQVVRLASEKVGKDLYRQIHDVSFTLKSGDIVEAITRNDASNDECSISAVDVYVVSKHLSGH